MRHLPSTSALGIGLAAVLPLLLPGSAHAGEADEPQRRGGQVEVMAGAAACIPGKGDCKAEELGQTAPSVGLAVDVGWRAHPAFFIGAGYGVGWFNPTWQLTDGPQFRTAYQQGVFGVLRAYLPIWRIDIGFEVSPGWTRQTFVAAQNDSRIYSQGFALRPGLSLDIWVGRHVFLGAKVDTIFNFHREVCMKSSSGRSCAVGDDPRHARVHQLVGGIHVGGTF